MILAGICLFNPFFGVMDDSSHLFALMPRIRAIGLWHATTEYMRGDLRLGVIRLTYVPMVAMLYAGASIQHSLPLFLSNWIFCVLVLLITNFLLAKTIRVSFWLLFVSQFAFFYFDDLFAWPSLQEKLLLPLGAALLYLISYKESYTWWRLLAALLIVTLGVVTKTSFVIFFVPATILLFGKALKEHKIRQILWSWRTILFLSFIAGTFFLGWLAIHGIYGAGKYDPAKIGPNLITKDFWYLSLPAIFSLILGWREWGRGNFNYFIPHFTLIGFFLVFLPWGIAAYIQTLIIPFSAACLVQVIEAPKIPKKIRSMGIFLVLAAAFTVTSYRTVRNYIRLADFRSALEYVVSHKDQSTSVWANCDEGSLAMQRYMTAMSNQAHSVTYWAKWNWQPENFTLVGDSALCPIPPFPDGCEATPLFTGRFSGSFSVSKIHCKSG